jgi:hypothetical protein
MFLELQIERKELCNLVFFASFVRIRYEDLFYIIFLMILIFCRNDVLIRNYVLRTGIFIYIAVITSNVGSGLSLF